MKKQIIRQTKPAPAKADNERLREALRWYEEKVAECRKIGSLGDNARQALDRDGGSRARDALSQQTAPQHPDDEAVDRFAVAMKAKLAASREKGRHGWQNATAPHLSALLYDHLYKADPLDVGNLAMMLHQNGQAIELPQEARCRKQTEPQPE